MGLGILGIMSCSTELKEELIEKLKPEMIVEDVHTFSAPEEAKITHLHWDANIDFDNKSISATATFDISKADNVSKIILDINGLEIHSVNDINGNALSFSIGEEKEHLGQALTIELKEDTDKIRIEYNSDPNSEAVQWLTSSQTTGGEKPFLFTQSQAILARSWIPVQDSPGVRFTYEASVTVPAGMMALMSAENPTEISESGVYSFKMDKPIPAYLLALAVGDIAYKKIGPRSGVYAEPSVLLAAAFEFAEIEDMILAAEELYGTYQWGVYDLLVLPPSFPFGGMENPRLTFATPTILAGDRSLTSLVAHELAHSWSGNLVTNATWNDFWLNEGFTVYFEQRIMEAVYGREYSEMLALLAYEGLTEEVAMMISDGQQKDTHLKLDLVGRNPDDGMTSIAYDKGYFFLRTIEELVGRDTFDIFLKNYFETNAFKVMTTEKFIGTLKKDLFESNGIAWNKKLVQNWIYGEGLPTEHSIPISDKFTKVEEVIARWKEGESITSLISMEDIFLKKWSSHEWLHFVRNLPEDMTILKMSVLDEHLKFTYTKNSEVLTAWMVHVIKHQYEPGFENLENFLISVGRRKFLTPLYGEMAKSEEGLKMAKHIYKKARPNYHYVSTSSIDAILNWEQTE